MNRRANILGRLRRWKTGKARYVVGLVAVGYLTAGVAPCAMAESGAAEVVDTVVREHAVAHEGGAVHEPHAAAHSQVGHEAHGGNGARHDTAPAPDDNSRGGGHCPHCFSGTTVAHAADRSSCVAFEDLTNAASHAKDAPKTLAPSFATAAVTLPPPLAPPRPPPLRAAGIPPVPLNVRHCVFLI